MANKKLAQKAYTNWIFCDESGDLWNSNDRFLVGAAVGTRNPKSLRNVAQGVWKKYKKLIRSGTALHATELPSERVQEILAKFAQIDDLMIHVALLDKEMWWNREGNKHHLYNDLFTHLIKQAIRDDSMLDTMVVIETRPLVVLEQRDNIKKYQDDLFEKLDKYAALKKEQVQIRGKEDQEWGRALQIADFVAWSTYQKYQKGNPKYLDVLQPKIKTILRLGVDVNGVMCPVAEMLNE